MKIKTCIMSLQKINCAIISTQLKYLYVQIPQSTKTDCSFSSWFQSPFQISYIFASLFNSLHLDFPKQYWWKTERQEMCLIHHSIFKVQHFFILFSSVELLSHVWLFMTHGLHHARLPCPSLTCGVYSKSCPRSRWYHPTILSSAVPFSCLQSFPASGSFPVSQFFASGGQSIEISASASVFPMNIQGWFPLGWTGWISLQSKGLSRVFANTVQKH